jgi:phytoene dehydrogenase-like protein
MIENNAAATQRSPEKLDTIIVGSGPNGLAAGITLARAGRSVRIYEANDTIGGGSRTTELTLPGFHHDICSAIHPLGVGSPFFRGLPLASFGLEWVFPPYALAHPLDDGTAVVVQKSISATAETMGVDSAAYHRLFAPMVGSWKALLSDLLGPLPIPPRHPAATIPFALLALRSAAGFNRRYFRGERARAVFAGMAAHSILPLDAPVTASFGLMLSVLAHALGWPMARGGSRNIVGAMARYFSDLGGEIVTGSPIMGIEQLPDSRATLFDLTPRTILQIAGDRFPASYRSALGRYQYGPGVFKIDYALDAPIPWTAKACSMAGTVHLGGTFEEISRSERDAWEGRYAQRPFVILVQQSLFDSTRAPAGKHTLWAYCHVPHGSSRDMTQSIEDQIERFAPGFRNRILHRHSCNAQEMEMYNSNYVGGDINSGAQTITQFFTRPVARFNPYTTPARGLYICSSSTPPGGGVHGMCGYYAAHAALRDLRGRR